MMQAFLVFICLASATLAFAPQPLTVKRGIPALPQTPASTRSPITFLRDASVSDQETDDTTLQAQSAVNVTTASNDTQVAVAPVDGQKEPEVWVDESKNVELIGLLVWGISLSAFILYNNFVEPWPMPTMVEVPIRFWRIIHVVSGMMFGGGIILTTLIEWLVASNKNPPVLQFWFDKVPLLDAAVVLPSLSISVISGTGLAIENYGGLGEAPVHIAITFYALVAFAFWWAVTDLTTQGKALSEVNEWVIASTDDNTVEMPKVVSQRRLSNIVSCLFVVALYGIMILKPGVIYWKDHFQ